jgi:inosine-uridine nucleoside N-ribohydrolase
MDVNTSIDDDAIAIMMALQSLEIEIVCMTSIIGNTSVRIADVNTLGSKDRGNDRLKSSEAFFRPLSLSLWYSIYY